MFKKWKGKLVAAVPLSGVALVSPVAFASGGGVDVGPVVTAIQGASVPIASIGAAVLIVLVGIKVYKWVRRAM